MASFRGHLAFSASLGAVFGTLAHWQLGFDVGTAALAGGLTAVGGMLPDLDSDSGVPVREMFNLAAVFVPLMLLRRFMRMGLEPEEILVAMGVIYVVIRFGARRLFKKYTVHRGMFHSVPAILIAGLLTLLMYNHPHSGHRLLIATGVMLGFFSHLLLDEIYSVDFRGLKPQLNNFAGSALKFTSKSRPATGMTYILLALLSAATFADMKPKANAAPTVNVPAQHEPPPIPFPPPE